MSAKLCACGNPRRRNHNDCTTCHRERQRQYRKNKRHHRERQEKIIALLTSRDDTTEAQFHARFTTDLVNVVKADGSCFGGIVVGFLPAGRVVVMDRAGAPRLASLDQLTERKLGQTLGSGPAGQQVGTASVAKELIDVRTDRGPRCPCGAPRRPGQNNCLKCHREKQSDYRKREWGRLFKVCSPLRNVPLDYPQL